MPLVEFQLFFEDNKYTWIVGFNDLLFHMFNSYKYSFNFILNYYYIIYWFNNVLLFLQFNVAEYIFVKPYLQQYHSFITLTNVAPSSKIPPVLHI